MRFLVVLAIVMAMAKVTGQSSEQVPQAVKITFQDMYPGENDPDWHLDAHNNFESHFKIDGVKHRADYSADGKWIETEISINKKELPKAIKEAIKQNYPKEEISEIEKVEHHSKGLFYDVEFKQKGKNRDVEFKPDGSLVN